MSSVEQASVEEILKGPPNAFDIALMVGHISFREIDPKAQAFGDTFPFLHVAPNALLALGDEGLDSVVFDIIFRVDAEFFANLDLDRQSVGIPTGLAIAPIPSHGSVAREEIFDRPGQAVARVGQSVGRRGAFEKDKRFGSLPQQQRLFIDVVVFPELEDRFFLLGKLNVGLYSSKHRSLVIRKYDRVAVLVQLFIEGLGIRVAFEHPIVDRFDLVFVLEFFLEIVIEIVVEVLFVEVIEGVRFVVFLFGGGFLWKIIVLGLFVIVAPGTSDRGALGQNFRVRGLHSGLEPILQSSHILGKRIRFSEVKHLVHRGFS